MFSIDIDSICKAWIQIQGWQSEKAEWHLLASISFDEPETLHVYMEYISSASPSRMQPHLRCDTSLHVSNRGPIIFEIPSSRLNGRPNSTQLHQDQPHAFGGASERLSERRMGSGQHLQCSSDFADSVSIWYPNGLSETPHA